MNSRDVCGTYSKEILQGKWRRINTGAVATFPLSNLLMSEYEDVNLYSE